jgi:hypothetical protein
MVGAIGFEPVAQSKVQPHDMGALLNEKVAKLGGQGQ